MSDETANLRVSVGSLLGPATQVTGLLSNLPPLQTVQMLQLGNVTCSVFVITSVRMTSAVFRTCQSVRWHLL